MVERIGAGTACSVCRLMAGSGAVWSGAAAGGIAGQSGGNSVGVSGGYASSVHWSIAGYGIGRRAGRSGGLADGFSADRTLGLAGMGSGAAISGSCRGPGGEVRAAYGAGSAGVAGSDPLLPDPGAGCRS